MKLTVFSSGSSGNCTVIKTHDSNIMIDCGLSKKQIEMNLNDINLTLNDIDGLFITHEHTDHIKAFAQMLKICTMTIYLTKGTYKEIYKYFKSRNQDKVCALMDERFNNNTIVLIERITGSMMYNSITVKNTVLQIVPTFHDAVEPCGFVINDEDKKLVYITDTGYVHTGVYDMIVNADGYILESNHDPEILMHSERSYNLKIRILSDHGHLSNEDSMITLANVMGEKTKLVMHAHVSQECNLSQIIEMTRERVFDDFALDTTGIKFVILSTFSTGEYEL